MTEPTIVNNPELERIHDYRALAKLEVIGSCLATVRDRVSDPNDVDRLMDEIRRLESQIWDKKYLPQSGCLTPEALSEDLSSD